MNGKFRLKLNCILLIAVLIFSACIVVACNNDEPYNPYAHNNNFDVKMTECEDALEFSPIGFTPSYGVVFYVGVVENPEHYTYLGNALAKQGYLVAISNVRNINQDNYNPNISTLTKYQNVKFFVGGHDIGGGLAVRHAMDYAKHDYKVEGVILYAPNSFSKQMKDENGQLVLDEKNNPIEEHFSIEHLNIYTLLLEVDDVLRTADSKQTTKEHINNSVTTCYEMENTSSLYFSTRVSSAETDENAIAQRENTVDYTLEFLRQLSK